MERGTPFALSHRFFQTGPFRPANVERRCPGLVFAGIGHGAGRRRADGAGVGRAGRGAASTAMTIGRRPPHRATGRPAVGESAMTTLEAAYAECRALTKRSGTTYYWSTFVLPPREAPPRVGAVRLVPHRRRHRRRPRRPAADRSAPPRSPAFGDALRAAIDEGRVRRPVLHAVAHTVRAFAIDPTCFDRFLRSMTMDLTVDSYATWDDLLGYMDGSAAVIGEMMLPILEPTSPAALPHARDLGFAFQLTNFLRDVAEDLDRGRVYLPLEDVARFGADPWARRVDEAWSDADALRDRPVPSAVRVGRPGHRHAPGRVGALRAHRPRAVLRDPRSHRTAGYDVFSGASACRQRARRSPRSRRCDRPE